MGRVLTNRTTLQYAIESSIGVLPGSPIWKLLEENAINAFGSTITTVARNPISKSRQRRKGVITDLDSAVEIEHDLTLESFMDFAEAFMFARFVGPFNVSSASHGLAASGTAYTLTTALASAPPQNRLVFARGFLTAADNGLKLVGVGSTTTNIVVSGLTAEVTTAAQNAQLALTGVRGASGDIQIDANGDIISTVLDFTTLGLTAGQMIHVGGTLTVNRFATAADFGFVRAKTITANKITLDKRPNAFTIDNGSGKLIDLLFGQFLRNVDVTSADFLERSIQFELAEPNLQNPGPGDAYEYAVGNYANEMVVELPLTDKSTVTYAFVGTDTGSPTTTRKTNAATPVNPTATAGFGTTQDLARLRLQKVDETGITTCIKSMTVSLANGVTPEKCLGVLGASFMNYGNFEVDIEATLLFTHAEVPDAIRNNTTLTMDWVLRNGECAIGFDVPSLTLGGGDKEFPLNESVKINVTGQAFGDPTLGTSLSVSMFPFVPAS